ncbi:MAG: hypothetical protein KKF41_11145 [Actinobacteria bacterium]|nr:hypothetical protein [Actinomycetota bacterium]MBU1944944.1 hypothetical protein [Actinomycetota bacterium]MBU2688130.1 hypothetical protein [Actinomycetota bacterium]
MLKLNRLMKDQSGLVLRWVLGIVIGGAVVVFLLAEVGPILWVRVFGIQEAEDVANSVANEYFMKKNPQEAIQAAALVMQGKGFSDQEIRESVITFYPPGAPTNQYTSVKVTVIKYSPTLLTRHIKQLQKLSRVAITKEASIAPEHQ